MLFPVELPIDAVPFVTPVGNTFHSPISRSERASGRTSSTACLKFGGHGVGSLFHAASADSDCSIDFRRHEKDSRPFRSTNQKDAGESRTHSMLLCWQPPNRLTSASKDFRLTIFDLRFERARNRQSKIQNRKFQCPRWESNPSLGLRRAVCLPHTPRTESKIKNQKSHCLAEESNLVRRFRRPGCARHTRKANQFSKSRQQDLHPHGLVYETSASLLQPHRQTNVKAPASGIEPDGAVLEAAGFPKSTPVGE